MKKYSDSVERLLIRYNLGELLQDVVIKGFDWETKQRIADLKYSQIIDIEYFKESNYSIYVKSLIFYIYDCINECKSLISEDNSQYASYIKAMAYRRDGEFALSRKCQDQINQLPFYFDIHRKVSLRNELFARQSYWDPYLLINQMEQFKFGATELKSELREILQIEWEVIFETCWDKALEVCQPPSSG